MNGRVDGNYSTRLLVKLQGLGNIHSESGLWDVIHQAWNIKRTLIPPFLFVRSGNKKITNTWKTWKWKVCRWCQVELNASLASLAFHFNLVGFLKASAKKKKTLSFESVCLILYLSDMSRLSLFYDSMGEKNISFRDSESRNWLNKAT